MKVDKRQRWIPEYIYIASPDIASFLLAILVYDGIFLTIFLRRAIIRRAYLYLFAQINRTARLYKRRLISVFTKIPLFFS